MYEFMFYGQLWQIIRREKCLKHCSLINAVLTCLGIAMGIPIACIALTNISIAFYICISDWHF
jgi:hypothetical protein